VVSLTSLILIKLKYIKVNGEEEAERRRIEKQREEDAKREQKLLSLRKELEVLGLVEADKSTATKSIAKSVPKAMPKFVAKSAQKSKNRNTLTTGSTGEGEEDNNNTNNSNKHNGINNLNSENEKKLNEKNPHKKKNWFSCKDGTVFPPHFTISHRKVRGETEWKSVGRVSRPLLLARGLGEGGNGSKLNALILLNEMVDSLTHWFETHVRCSLF
jgi:hypothetical protein